MFPLLLDFECQGNQVTDRFQKYTRVYMILSYGLKIEESDKHVFFNKTIY